MNTSLFLSSLSDEQLEFLVYSPECSTALQLDAQDLLLARQVATEDEYRRRVKEDEAASDCMFKFC